MSRPRVVIVRGVQVNPWDLRPLEDLADEFDISYLLPAGNLYELGLIKRLRAIRVRVASDFVPVDRASKLVAGVPLNRYLDFARHVAEADIVHAAELAAWHSTQSARFKDRLGYRLVTTVWETIPFLDTYRVPPVRAPRRRMLAQADLFLAATERARNALLLEGAPPDRIVLSGPGIDLDRFRVERAPTEAAEHLLVAPGRLVWEKGHQDVLRALAALRRGLVDGVAKEPRLVIVGGGPDRSKLRAFADELGVSDLVELRGAVSYEEMPKLYSRASAMVLASLITRRWEEQFGMVLAEARAAGLRIVASAAGAIPEVAGPEALLFAPGDWLGLARRLLEGPLAAAPGERVPYPSESLESYSSDAAAARLRAAYRRVLNGG